VRHRRLLVALAFALPAACTADSPSDDPATGGADALEWRATPTPDLDDLEVAVGSKAFPEQEILGWIAVEALRAAGADVQPEIGLGGTVVAREAELAGLVDMYWEYTGTGWVELLQQTGPSTDPEELYDEVREVDREENDIAWLEPAPANNGYSLVAAESTLEALDVQTVEDAVGLLADEEEQVSLCVSRESGFIDDPSGLLRLQSTYDVTIPASRITPADRNELVSLVEDGVFCTFAQVVLTSPLLVDASVEQLEDPEGAFIVHNPSMTVRVDVLDGHPDVEDVFEEIAPLLTDEQLRELNARVEEDDDDPREVARDWLVDEGLAT